MNSTLEEMLKDKTFLRFLGLFKLTANYFASSQPLHPDDPAEQRLDLCLAYAFKAGERRKASCPHPGCCCVCGHQGKCPEDGPSIVQGVYD